MSLVVSSTAKQLVKEKTKINRFANESNPWAWCAVFGLICANLILIRTWKFFQIIFWLVFIDLNKTIE